MSRRSGASAIRTALVVSPHFPPSTLAGVHRARHLAKHLPEFGWHPVIVRVDEAAYAERPDPELAALVPESVEQVRTGAYPADLCRRVGFGDIGLRAYPHLGRTLEKLAAERRPDLVFITGSPFYPLLLGRRLSERFGLPVVLDFQDPWVSAHGARQPRRSKAGLSHRLATLLEPRALRAAAAVTSVSETQNDEMAARYPWLDRSRMAAIPIGGDPEDFEALRRAGAAQPGLLEAGMLNLSYVGAFLPRAEPVARQLLRAMAALRASQPALAARMRLNFVGTSNQPDGLGRFQVMPLAQQEGVADLVRETPERVPFLDALGILANSHGLLLIGSDEPHYTASKIYPALMSGRPYISLFHAASSAHAILSAAGGGASFAFETPEELAGLTPRLTESLTRLATRAEDLGRADPAIYAPYTARSVAGRFAALFDEVVR